MIVDVHQAYLYCSNGRLDRTENSCKLFSSRFLYKICELNKLLLLNQKNQVMKRFKFGFLAIIAVLAIGLTAATRPEVVKEFSPKDTFLCTSGTDYKLVDYNSGSQIIMDDQCTSSISCVTFNSGSSQTITATDDLTCDSQNDVVCCIEVVTNTDPECTVSNKKNLIVHCKTE
jgi:hypothetical protein